MPTQNRLSLRNIELTPFQFTPGTFTPGQFTPSIEDYSGLQKAFVTLAERKKDANEKVSALDKAFDLGREQLHNDEKTMQWYRQYTDDMKARMDNLKMLGDYSYVDEIATHLAGNFMGAKEYTARAKRNQEYTEWEKAVDAATVSQTKKDYYKDTYKYDDSDMFDSAGNVIEGKKWDKPIPKGDLHWDTIYRQSAADVAEAMSSNQRSGGFTGDYTANQWQSGYETHAKELSKIVANVKEYFKNNQGEWDKFEEDYKVLRWEYNNLIKARAQAIPGTEEYKDADDAVKSFINAHTFSEDGFPSREDLILQKISEENPYIKNFAYIRKSTNTDNRTTNKPAAKKADDLAITAAERDLYGDPADDTPEPAYGESVAQDVEDADMEVGYMNRKFAGRVVSNTRQSMKKSETKTKK